MTSGNHLGAPLPDAPAAGTADEAIGDAGGLSAGLAAFASGGMAWSGSLS